MADSDVEDESNEQDGRQADKGCRFTDNETKLLIAERKDKDSAFREKKTHSGAWNQILNVFKEKDVNCKFTVNNLKDKWNYLTRTYKKHHAKKIKSGGKGVSWQWYTKMDEFLGKNDDVTFPERLVTVGGPEGVQNLATLQTPSSSGQKKRFTLSSSSSIDSDEDGFVPKKKSKIDGLLEIQRIQFEEMTNRQKRMEILLKKRTAQKDDMIFLMKQLVENTTGQQINLPSESVFDEYPEFQCSPEPEVEE